MRYSKEEKAKWLENWRGSGKTAWAYAKENGLAPQTFTNWTKAKSKNKQPLVEIPAKMLQSTFHHKEITIEKGEVKIHIPPVMIEQQMAGEPFSGDVYLFCNRGRRLLKAVWWDRNGFWLAQKRLEKDRFPWPETEEEARETSAEELSMLLAGIDFFKAHKALYYKKVS